MFTVLCPWGNLWERWENRLQQECSACGTLARPTHRHGPRGIPHLPTCPQTSTGPDTKEVLACLLPPHTASGAQPAWVCIVTLSHPSWDLGQVTLVRNLGGTCEGHSSPSLHSTPTLSSGAAVCAPWGASRGLTLLAQERCEAPRPGLVRGNSNDRPTACAPRAGPRSLHFSLVSPSRRTIPWDRVCHCSISQVRKPRLKEAERCVQITQTIAEGPGFEPTRPSLPTSSTLCSSPLFPTSSSLPAAPQEQEWGLC